MGESLIVRRGGSGGLKATDAILRVTAMAGATVTISKGAVSKSDLGHENAEDHTFYDYYFIIHASQFDSENAWTVTAVKDSVTISGTIIIDAPDEYDLWLAQLYLYDHGTQYVSFGGSAGQYASYSFQADNIYTYSNTSKNYSTVGIYTTSKIDLTPWSTLTFKTDYYSQTSGNPAFAVGAASTTGQSPTYVAKLNPSRNNAGVIQTLNVDVSSLADSYFIVWSGAASTHTYEVYLR